MPKRVKPESEEEQNDPAFVYVNNGRDDLTKIIGQTNVMSYRMKCMDYDIREIRQMLFFFAKCAMWILTSELLQIKGTSVQLYLLLLIAVMILIDFVRTFNILYAWDVILRNLVIDLSERFRHGHGVWQTFERQVLDDESIGNGSDDDEEVMESFEMETISSSESLNEDVFQTIDGDKIGGGDMTEITTFD